MGQVNEAASEASGTVLHVPHWLEPTAATLELFENGIRFEASDNSITGFNGIPQDGRGSAIHETDIRRAEVDANHVAASRHNTLFTGDVATTSIVTQSNMNSKGSVSFLDQIFPEQKICTISSSDPAPLPTTANHLASKPRPLTKNTSYSLLPTIKTLITKTQQEPILRGLERGSIIRHKSLDLLGEKGPDSSAAREDGAHPSTSESSLQRLNVFTKRRKQHSGSSQSIQSSSSLTDLHQGMKLQVSLPRAATRQAAATSSRGHLAAEKVANQEVKANDKFPLANLGPAMMSTVDILSLKEDHFAVGESWMLDTIQNISKKGDEVLEGHAFTHTTITTGCDPLTSKSSPNPMLKETVERNLIPHSPYVRSPLTTCAQSNAFLLGPDSNMSLKLKQDAQTAQIDTTSVQRPPKRASRRRSQEKSTTRGDRERLNPQSSSPRTRVPIRAIDGEEETQFISSPISTFARAPMPAILGAPSPRVKGKRHKEAMAMSPTMTLVSPSHREAWTTPCSPQMRMETTADAVHTRDVLLTLMEGCPGMYPQDRGAAEDTAAHFIDNPAESRLLSMFEHPLFNETHTLFTPALIVLALGRLYWRAIGPFLRSLIPGNRSSGEEATVGDCLGAILAAPAVLLGANALAWVMRLIVSAWALVFEWISGSEEEITVIWL
jgi:hypothetical protein